MPLKIIYGRAGSGKSHACLDAAEKLIAANDGDVIFIVPEQFSLMTERKLADRMHGVGGGFDVLSFERMASRVFSQVGPVYAVYMTGSGKQMLMQRVLIRLKDRLAYLCASAETDGFCGVLVETVDSLKKSGITPAMLADAANRLGGIAALKLADLSQIYAAYTQAFEYPNLDDADSPALLLEKIRQFDLFRGAHIILDAFSGFTPLQLALIEAFLLRCKSVTVALTTDSLAPTDNISDLFYAEKRTVNTLLDMAVKNNIEVLPSTYLGCCKRHENNPELAHLEDNLLRYPARTYDKPTERITVFEASNYYGEVESAAAQIIRLCRENNYRFRDIAVATKALGTYAPLVRHIFEEYQINYNLDEKITALCHPLTRAVLSVLETVIRHFSYEAVFGWLKSPYCGLDDGDVFLLENYVLACGSTPGMWKNPQDWSFMPNGFDEAALTRVNAAKNAARSALIGFANKFSGRKTAREIAVALTEFLYESGADKTAQRQAEAFTAAGQIQNRNLLTSAWNGIIRVIDEIVSVLGDEQLTFEKFYAIFKAGLDGCEIGHIPPTVDEVLVCHVDRVAGQDVKCLFVLGASNGVFPESYTNEGLLSDSDKENLTAMGADLSDTTVLRQARESSVIYTTLTSPLDRLFLYYPIADSDGKAVYSSTIIERIKRLFPAIRSEDNIYDKDDVLPEIEGAVPTFNKMLQDGRRFAQAAAWFKTHMPDKYAAALAAKRYTNLPNDLSAGAVALLYGSLPKGSVSRAEQFNKCQYAYFLKYGLFAAEREQYTIEPRTAGSFMHEIIDRFSRFANDYGWKNITQKICAEKASELTGQVLTEYLGDAYTSSARFGYLTHKVSGIMSTTAWHIAAFYKKSQFVPLGYEIAFDTDGDMRPIEVEVDGHKLLLRGKVDRADILRTENGNYISIVDYKSSAKNIDFSEILCGVQIQLPTYISAVCEAISQKEGVRTMPAAMLYYKFDMPVITADRKVTDEEIAEKVQKALRMQGVTLEAEQVADGISSVFAVKSLATGEQIDRICKTAHKKLKDAFSQVLNGKIALNPVRIGGETACRYCPYGTVCAFDVNFAGNHYRNIKKIDREEFFSYVGQVDA